MQAVILAGGLGTRLRPITEKIPKCMAPVGDKPFLFYLLNLLKNRGIDDVVLCTGYLGAQVEDYLEDGREFGLGLHFSREKEKLLGTGGALKLAESLLKPDFLVINGDTYLDTDYPKIYQTFLARGRQSLVVSFPAAEGERSDLEINQDLFVTKYDRVAQGLGYVNAGILAFRREILSLIPSGGPVSLETEIFPLLIKKRQMIAYIIRDQFYDIGTFASLKGFENSIQEGNL